jgi:pyrimidine deaminase RibD-like protein
MAKKVPPAGASSTVKAARLLEIAAKVRQVPGSFKEGDRDLLHKGWMALGRLIKQAYEVGAWQREGSQIGDALRLALTSVGRDRPEWLAGETVPVWVLEAWGAVVGTLTSHLIPLPGEKEQAEFEAGMLADEIEREADALVECAEQRAAAVGARVADPDLQRKFMELAVEEARKSKPEDDKPHPKVGVVVVKNGDVLATAYRGELGKGDHGEFTALEKKLPDATVAGATVYTTLEPCTTRNHPKLPCAARLIERKVKRVVIGMHDPNRTVYGRGWVMLQEAGILTADFEPDLKAEIKELNREFIRHHASSAGGPATAPGT